MYNNGNLSGNGYFYSPFRRRVHSSISSSSSDSPPRKRSKSYTSSQSHRHPLSSLENLIASSSATQDESIDASTSRTNKGDKDPPLNIPQSEEDVHHGEPQDKSLLFTPLASPQVDQNVNIGEAQVSPSSLLDDTAPLSPLLLDESVLPLGPRGGQQIFQTLDAHDQAHAHTSGSSHSRLNGHADVGHLDAPESNITAEADVLEPQQVDSDEAFPGISWDEFGIISVESLLTSSADGPNLSQAFVSPPAYTTHDSNTLDTDESIASDANAMRPVPLNALRNPACDILWGQDNESKDNEDGPDNLSSPELLHPEVLPTSLPLQDSEVTMIDPSLLQPFSNSLLPPASRPSSLPFSTDLDAPVYGNAIFLTPQNNLFAPPEGTSFRCPSSQSAGIDHYPLVRQRQGQQLPDFWSYPSTSATSGWRSGSGRFQQGLASAGAGPSRLPNIVSGGQPLTPQQYGTQNQWQNLRPHPSSHLQAPHSQHVSGSQAYSTRSTGLMGIPGPSNASGGCVLLANQTATQGGIPQVSVVQNYGQPPTVNAPVLPMATTPRGIGQVAYHPPGQGALQLVRVVRRYYIVETTYQLVPMPIQNNDPPAQPNEGTAAQEQAQGSSADLEDADEESTSDSEDEDESDSEEEEDSESDRSLEDVDENQADGVCLSTKL